MIPLKRIGLGHIAGLTFLAAQVLAIAYARFAPERFFCWAPYDEHSRYTISVRIGEKTLTTGEVASRYRYQASGWEPRSIHNVISIVRQFEETYGESDDAAVTVRYVVNGHAERTWAWPQ